MVFLRGIKVPDDAPGAVPRTCWCGMILRDFMVRTMAASMACCRSLATSSVTRFFSSATAGSTICENGSTPVNYLTY